MAQIAFAETNRARLVATLPCIIGSQVAASNTANHTDLVLYTVTTNKLLLLFGYDFNSVDTATGSDTAIYVTNASNALQYYLSRFRHAVIGTLAKQHDYSQPLEIPAGYNIRISSSSLTAYCDAMIRGIEI